MNDSLVGEGEDRNRFQGVKKSVITFLGVFLCLFTLFEVNYNQLQPQSSAGGVCRCIGLVLCFLAIRSTPRARRTSAFQLSTLCWRSLWSFAAAT